MDCDQDLRQGLAVLQAEDRLNEDLRVIDPPLLRLESESAHAYLSVLLHIILNGDASVSEACDVETRLVGRCTSQFDWAHNKPSVTAALLWKAAMSP